LGINPVEALTELGYLEYGEVMTFMDMGGQLLDTAEDGELALELARRLNPATHAPLIDELEARSATPHLHAVADSSPGEDELRAQQDGGGFDEPRNPRTDSLPGLTAHTPTPNNGTTTPNPQRIRTMSIDQPIYALATKLRE